MNTTSTIGQYGKLAEHDLLQGSLVFKDHRWRVTTAEGEQAKKPAKHGLVFHIITFILVGLAAVAMFEFTGLYYGVESIVGKIILMAVTAYCYLVAFRRGLYS